MWELDCEESWALKLWCFWTVVLEKTPESPLDCMGIQPVHSKGDQSWVFFGRNNAKAETPLLWPPHAKSWLIVKDSDVGRDWGQEEKGMIEDEMAAWHHRLDGHESEWTPGVGDGQGGLACCSYGVTNSRTRQSNWTELNWKAESEEELKKPLDESESGEWKSWLKAQHSENEGHASGPITSWEIDGEIVEIVSDCILGGSKITADGDCSHEIKRRLLLGRKVMTNLDSILKSKDITLPTKVCLVKAMVFPVVMYGCESCTVKKAERQRIDAFELWC